ncbi:MAG: glycosyltransferase, partial [Dechloromonas sp.]|nr:glycosyltransferase [Dechloromonas sp.]
RRFYRPFVTYYLALSRDLGEYLTTRIKVPEDKVLQVYNGVDTDRFHPVWPDHSLPGSPFARSDHWVVGTVGRMQTVKDQPMLVRAFVRALQIDPALRTRIRLAMIGDGPLRAECEQLLAAAGASNLAWLPGERHDIPEIMGGLDCFVLPSLAEGISNTILEAMASGLPVIATDVGGNADLVAAGITGQLVPPGDLEELAQEIVALANNPACARRMGQLGRERVEENFSMKAMVAAYSGTYDKLLGRSGVSA